MCTLIFELLYQKYLHFTVFLPRRILSLSSNSQEVILTLLFLTNIFPSSTFTVLWNWVQTEGEDYEYKEILYQLLVGWWKNDVEMHFYRWNYQRASWGWIHNYSPLIQFTHLCLSFDFTLSLLDDYSYSWQNSQPSFSRSLTKILHGTQTFY